MVQISLEFDEHTIEANSRFGEIIYKIFSSPASTLIVVDGEGSVLGTVTDGDIRHAISSTDNYKELTAGQIANKFFFFINKEDLESDSHLTLPKKIRLIPIMEGVALHGVYLNKQISNNQNCDGLIMAGGFGKRMGVLTEATPKPLLEVSGKPMIIRIIEKLVDAGIERIFISTHYLFEKIQETLGDGSKWGIQIHYIYEEKPLGTAGCLSLLPDDLKSNLVICNGDIVSDIDFSWLTEFHENKASDFTLVTHLVDTEIPFGVVHSIGYKFHKLEEKPVIKNHVNAGVYCVNTKHLNQLKFNQPIDMPDFINQLAKSDFSVLVYPLYEDWNDVGNPSVLQKVNNVI